MCLSDDFYSVRVALHMLWRWLARFSVRIDDTKPENEQCNSAAVLLNVVHSSATASQIGSSCADGQDSKPFKCNGDRVKGLWSGGQVWCSLLQVLSMLHPCLESTSSS